MVRAPCIVIVAVALLASCATTPRAADGPRPQLGVDESLDLQGAASITPAPPPPPTVSSVRGPFCGEVVGTHAHRPGTLCPVDPDAGD